MSESEEHRELVRNARHVVNTLYPNTDPVVDLPQRPGDELPPTIGGHRPDLYFSRAGLLVIGEAKTYRDLDARRTYDQVATFVRLVHDRPSGLFLLSVSSQGADLARSLLRVVCSEFTQLDADVAVWDELDLWLLEDDIQHWRLLGLPTRPTTSSPFLQ